jgi:hypothetical protein
MLFADTERGREQRQRGKQGVETGGRDRGLIWLAGARSWKRQGTALI